MLLTKEELKEAKKDPVRRKALAQTFVDFSQSSEPSFEVLESGGRGQVNEMRLVVRLAYTQSSRAEPLLALFFWGSLLALILFGILYAISGEAWFIVLTAGPIFGIIVTPPLWAGNGRVRDRTLEWLREARQTGAPSTSVVQKIRTRQEARDALSALSPQEFERKVAEIFRSYGYEAEVTQFSQDFGVDLILGDDSGVKDAVQIKQYTRGLSVGRPALQMLQGAMLNAKADRATFVTLSHFSEPARRYAQAHAIRLIDGEELVDMHLESERGS